MYIRFSFYSFTIPKSFMQLAKWELLFYMCLFKNWLGQDKVMNGCLRAPMKSCIYYFLKSSLLMKNRHHTRLSMPSRYANVHKTQKNLWITLHKWLQILALQFFIDTWGWCLQAVGIVWLQTWFRNECDLDFIVARFAVSKQNVLVSYVHLLIVCVPR